jgi:antitoxin (DNA-binding transcriptional repressor) of toxin-antitoxin stability system
MTVTVEEAQSRRPELIDELARGGPLTITRGDRPVAQLVPPPAEKPRPVPGRGRGKIIIVSDDDEHLKDFEECMPSFP